ncbi:MAG: DUF4123 domain-containing protein [Paracoccus sp. (in: a-proteobacteria)]|nr:DUF4123 domain-containing protein [Paracoccus sp. (in: a-proteobacteria)]
MPLSQSTDLWLMPRAAMPEAGSGDGPSAMDMRVIADVIPLDHQPAVLPRQSVPPALMDALFGPQPQPDASPDGTADPAAPGTYAVLDAAKIANLPEELENGGLPHLCLFRGAAQQEWGHVAPWLVALTPEARLTRRLFTDKPYFGLWPAAAAMFVRSDLGLDALWRHFRRFTRIRDGQQRWLFFRFWEAQSLVMLHESAHLPGAKRFFAPCLSVLAPVPDRAQCILFTRQPPALPWPMAEAV